MTGQTRSADVVVVGAGPAGTATAILLAERGWSVTLLDKAGFPRPRSAASIFRRKPRESSTGSVCSRRWIRPAHSLFAA